MILSTCIWVVLCIVLLSSMSSVLLHLVNLFEICIFFLLNFGPSLSNRILNFILDMFYFSPSLHIFIKNAFLLCFNTHFCWGSMLLNSGPGSIFLILKVFVHLGLIIYFVLFNLMHMLNKLCLPHRISYSLISSLFFLIQFNNSSLYRGLLKCHLLQMIFGIHHIILVVDSTHTSHEHTVFLWWSMWHKLNSLWVWSLVRWRLLIT